MVPKKRKAPHVKTTLGTFTEKATAKVQKIFDMYKSTAKKSAIIRKIVAQWYEPGRQDRCKLWIYRNKVKPVLGISERTFFRMLDEKLTKAVLQSKQEPTLFDIDMI